MIAIKNATLIMKDHLIPDAVLFIENGLIAGFGEMRIADVSELERLMFLAEGGNVELLGFNRQTPFAFIVR